MRFGPGITVEGSSGRYRIDRVIGSGAAAVIASARAVGTDQMVAIKCLRSEVRVYPNIAERFAREARAVARLRGKHVAHVLDIGEIEGGLPFMVMEYLEGCDLEEYLRDSGPLPVGEAVGYIVEACSALEEAHALGIIHRDVKPANLFLAEQGGRRILKVLDFGVSKVLDEIDTSLTKSSTLLGTASYMSPEQLRSSKNVDARTDVWALGATLFELLVGAPPFAAASMHELMEKLACNDRALVRTSRPEVPLGLEKVIDRALSRDRDQRYATIAELARDLASFAPPPDERAPWKRRRVLLVGAAMGLVAVVVVVLVVLSMR